MMNVAETDCLNVLYLNKYLDIIQKFIYDSVNLWT